MTVADATSHPGADAVDGLTEPLLREVAAGRLVRFHAEESAAIAAATTSLVGRVAHRLGMVSRPTDVGIEAGESGTPLANLHELIDPARAHELSTAVAKDPESRRVVLGHLSRMLQRFGLGDRVLIETNTHFRIALPVPERDGVAPTTVPRHRDKWYELPAECVNIWIPCTKLQPGDGVVLYPEAFDKGGDPVWDEERKHFVPAPDDDAQRGEPVAPAIAVGECLAFAGEHLHESGRNPTDTRVSWDYRVVRVDGLAASGRLKQFSFPDFTARSDGDTSVMQLRTAARLGASPKTMHLATAVMPTPGMMAHGLRTAARSEARRRTKPAVTVLKSATSPTKWERRIRTVRNLLDPTRSQYALFESILRWFEDNDQKWRRRGSEVGLTIGDYYEFGVWNGASLVRFHEAVRRVYGRDVPDYWRIHGFDSFGGIPELTDEADVHPFMGKGSFLSKGEQEVKNRLLRAGCPKTRFSLTRGLFDQSLTPELRESFKGRPATFVNIDCDTFTATKVVLDWIEPLLHDGSIVYFDDIYFYNLNPQKGELRAIHEFNATRKNSGLAVATAFDQAQRVYMYWRNEDVKSEDLVFDEF